MINDMFQYLTGYELKYNEEVSTFKNAEGEWCFRIYNVDTKEVIKEAAF